MIIALESVLLVLIAGSVAYYTWCAISTVQFFFANKLEPNVSCQPVSVLIPVAGVDEDAKKNWESFLAQDYENYEVLFGVMNPKDPAIPILEEVVARSTSARLISGLEVLGLNYQISNIIHLIDAAKHELVIITDSDMYVLPEYLRTITTPLADDSVGLVTCGYVAHAPKYLVAALGSLGRCIDNLPSILLARKLNGGSLDFAIGATMATRKSILAKAGGLQSIVNSIGSDYLIGNMVAKAGYRVELSTYVMETDPGRESFQQLFRRELRWAKTIRWNTGPIYYGNIFTYGTVYCMILLLLAGFHPWAAIVCFATFAVRTVQALLAIYGTGCPKLARWLWTLPLRDLLSFVTFVGGAFGNSIYWRGRRLSIGVGGILTE